MNKFKFIDNEIEGVKLIEPFCAPDNRGYFSKPYEKDIYAENGINFVPYEELRSFSKKGVIRGLHFQRENCQDKLVQVVAGAVYDVVVDLRYGSTTFGKWLGFELTAENRNMLYIPKGFAHGFLALEDNTVFSYLCGEKYDSLTDGGIKWNDADLAVTWPIDKVKKVIISDKDDKLQTFAEFKDKYGGLGI